MLARPARPTLALQAEHGVLPWPRRWPLLALTLVLGIVIASAVTIGPRLVERVLVLARRADSISDPAADELARRLRG